VNLRRTIFLAVSLAVVVTTALEGLFDVLGDRLVELVDAGAPADGRVPTWLARLAEQRLVLDLVDIPIVLALVALGAWLLARRLATPLRQLTLATREVAREAFPKPIAVPAGGDELAELAESFNDMVASIQGYVERERAFTRYASHELRTPLSALRLQLERVELGHATAEEVLPAVARSAAQLEEILAALLELARSAGSEHERRLLSPLLADSLAVFPHSERERVTIHNAAPAELAVTHGRLFQQALTNLVDNALRHGSGTTTVRLEAHASSLTLRVRDEGHGVDVATLERVTEPFYRSGSSEGTGLGLAFVSFIARALEGELTLDSSGWGLEAVLTLPIVADVAEA